MCTNICYLCVYHRVNVKMRLHVDTQRVLLKMALVNKNSCVQTVSNFNGK